jgi:pilus assembly protein FimV
MLLRTLVRAWVLALLVPAGAMALGLGDIHLKSTLNSPLDAEIDLVGAAPEDLQGLKATIASRDSFLRYGLDYPAFVSGVKLQPGKSADGRDVIKLSSADPITEPFATLLVEVNWARGHLLHEYTVLLDPPVFATQGPSTAAAVAAPVVGDATHSGTVQRPAAMPSAVAAPMATPSASAAPVSAAAGTYQVRAGDTLSNIAATHYKQSERERALVAIYRTNPHAFAGNMNVLRSGAELTLPAETDVAAVGPADANAEVANQYRTWAQNRPTASGSGQLRLVPPSAAPAAGAMPGAMGASGGPGKGTAADAAALQHQIGQLQTDLAASQRLLEIKNAELAKLQQQLGGAGHPAAPSAPAAGPPAVAAPPVAAAPTAAPAPNNPAAPVAETKKPAVPAAKAAPAAPSAPGLLDWLLSYWYLPVGALALIAAALGWRAMRSRQDVSFDRSLDQLTRPADARAGKPADSHTQTQPIRTLTAPKDTSFLVEESGPHERPKIATDETDQLSTSQIVPLEGTMPTETVALDQGDPLAEADFHMAYGLYDQAADLIKIAISREPERRDLRLKLLEVYFVWGNKEQFLQLARELAASRDKTLPGEWEKVIIMGRQIAADDPLFGESGALPGAASAGVDLNLEGGQNRVDFDLLGEPSVHRDTADGVDLDLGAALGDKEATAESATLRDTGVDFVLDDPARGGDQTGSTREMPSSAGPSHTVTLEMDRLAMPRGAADSPTVEQPMVAGHGSVQERLEAAMGGVGGDRTAELAIDDLGLDLHGAEHLDVGATGMHEAPTMRANLDEETRNLMQAGTPGAQEDNATLSAPTASGTWLFTDAELSTVLPSMKSDAPTELVTQIMPQASEDPGATGRLKALKADPGTLDIDLGSTGMMPKVVLDKDSNGSGLDLDVGHQTTSPAGDTARLSGLDLDVGRQAAESGDTTATRRLDKGDMVLPDLEPATLSEIGTKLDLARAYMDMGDPEGARNILEEVLSEGSVSQKQEARRLIDSLPG